MSAAYLQVAIESAVFIEKGRYFMTVCLSHPDAQDPLNQNPTIHRTSLSSGHSESAIFNMHSFNLGDVSGVSPDTQLDFKAYKLVNSGSGGAKSQELLGQF